MILLWSYHFSQFFELTFLENNMKTIVSDLDGTLLNSYGEVDSFTKEVLNTSPIHRQYEMTRRKTKK